MKNHTTEAYEFLEARKPGLFRELIGECVARGGVYHASPECFLIGIPDPDDPETVIIMFQCSDLEYMWRLGVMYSDRFKRVKWRRDFKNKYATRTMSMERLMAKAKLALVGMKAVENNG
jgi:hypothetical protein